MKFAIKLVPLHRFLLSVKSYSANMGSPEASKLAFRTYPYGVLA